MFFLTAAAAAPAGFKQIIIKFLQTNKKPNEKHFNILLSTDETLSNTYLLNQLYESANHYNKFTFYNMLLWLQFFFFFIVNKP